MSGKNRESVHHLPSKNRRPLQFTQLREILTAFRVEYGYKFWQLPNSAIVFHAWVWPMNPMRLQYFSAGALGNESVFSSIGKIQDPWFVLIVPNEWDVDLLDWVQGRATKMFGAPLWQWMSERARVVQPGEEKPVERLYWGLPVLKGELKKHKYWLSSRACYDRTGNDGFKLKETRFRSDIRKNFLQWGWWNIVTGYPER